jgi:hypothetical protein
MATTAKEEVMNRQKPIVNDSPGWRIARRTAAAGMALAAVLTLGACKATGGGYIDEPLDGGPVSVFNGQADFGFNYTCDMSKGNRARIQGEITYHDNPSTVDGVIFPEIRLHGTVDPFFIEDVTTCAEAAEQFEGIPTALFQGNYRSQDKKLLSKPPGRFTIQVFDNGEPGTGVGIFEGDEFSIDLAGGPYTLYTRAGFIEGGNIQVSNK